MAIKMTIIQKGPLLVSGDLSELEIAGSDGQPVDLGGKDKIFLCRCGASVNKPFCDGTHSKIGFQRPRRRFNRPAEPGRKAGAVRRPPDAQPPR